MIRSWKYSILKVLDYWSLLLVIYFVQLVLAVFVAVKFSNIIKLELWQSLNFKQLLTGYDHGIISDFRRVFAEDLDGLHGSIAVIFGLYLLVSLLLNGGLIASVVEKRNSVRYFFKQGMSYYFKNGFVVIVSLLLLAIWASITLLPLTTLFQKVMDGLITEPQLLVYLLLGGSAFYLGFCLIFCWSVIARMNMIQGLFTFWKSIRNAFSQVIKRTFGCIGLLSLFVFLQVVFILIYLFIENKTGMKSMPSVMLFLIIQQLFVLLRIGWRVMVYLGIEHAFLTKNNIGTIVNE